MFSSRKGGRLVSIWSVWEDDQRFYANSFVLICLLGVIAYLVCIMDWDKGNAHILESLILHIGPIGLSSAILALLILAVRGFILALFDWGRRWRTQETTAKEIQQLLNDWVKNDPNMKKLVDEGKIEVPDVTEQYVDNRR